MTYTEYKIVRDWIKECPEINCNKESIKYFYGTQFIKDRIVRIQLRDAVNDLYKELGIYKLLDTLEKWLEKITQKRGNT